MKKPVKITIVTILLLIPFYLLITFFTRDIGRDWCELSFGTYERVFRCSGLDSSGKLTGCTDGPDRLCTGGIFNIEGGRNNQAPESLSLTPIIF